MLNFFYTFNEFILLIVELLLLMFLDSSMPEDEQNLYGWMVVGCIMLAVIVNWGIILPTKLIEGFYTVRSIIDKRD